MGKFLAVVAVAFLLVGCAAQRAPSSTYGVAADGTVTAQTRSAVDGSLAPGRQELFAFYLPIPPFDFRAGITWDGTPITFNPVAPAAQAQAAPQAATCEEVMVPVQRTRMVPQTYTELVPQKRVAIPVPQAAQPQCPCPPVATAEPTCPAPAVVAVAGK